MTALAARPPVAWFPARRDDRATMLLAFGAALGLKVALLLALPLPARPQAPPLPSATGPTFSVTPLPLTPPDLPPPPERRPAIGERLVPVPFAVAPDVAPVAEPAAAPSPADAVAAGVTPLLDGVTGPPPADPAIWNEDDPRVTAPRPAGPRTRPAFPEIARLAGRHGTVVLEVVVDESGDVGAIEVLSAPALDLGFVEAAVAAVSRWRYEPGTVRGRPVQVAVRVIVEFTLD